MSVDTLALWSLWGLAGWVLYFRERGRSRDYVTDLMSVVHDHDLGREDLRRSTDWREVRRHVEEEQDDA